MALAVSGQTRIHWESSARGALRFVRTQIQNNTRQVFLAVGIQVYSVVLRARHL
jgi:hypothetical protein